MQARPPVSSAGGVRCLRTDVAVTTTGSAPWARVVPAPAAEGRTPDGAGL